MKELLGEVFLQQIYMVICEQGFLEKKKAYINYFHSNHKSHLGMFQRMPEGVW